MKKKKQREGETRIYRRGNECLEKEKTKKKTRS